MAMQKILCPFCGSDKVVFNGKDQHGNQRCMCKNPKCSHTTFAMNYKNNGSKPGIEEEIIDHEWLRCKRYSPCVRCI